MRVFLVPFGPERYGLYCEPRDGDADASAAAEAPGVLKRLLRRFREVIALAEQNRWTQGEAQRSAGSWVERTQAWAFGWIADRIAEQRLLWQLRGCREATLVHPSDVDPSEALRLMRRDLKRDRDRHAWWLAVDLTLLVLSGALAIVPGPNMIAYYFAFRVVGHYLSIRGARQGLGRVEWTAEPSPVLADLRTVLRMDPGPRLTRVRDIASRLELPHLVAFVERAAPRGA
jgi:hypothetical protein